MKMEGGSSNRYLLFFHAKRRRMTRKNEIYNMMMNNKKAAIGRVADDARLPPLHKCAAIVWAKPLTKEYNSLKNGDERGISAFWLPGQWPFTACSIHRNPSCVQHHFPKAAFDVNGEKGAPRRPHSIHTGVNMYLNLKKCRQNQLRLGGF